MRTQMLLLVGPLLLHALLVVLLLRHRSGRRFPWFLIYNIFSVLASGARLAAALENQNLYFYVYRYTDVGFAVLGILALHSVFRRAFAGFYLLSWFRWFYYGGIAVPVLLAAVHSILRPPVDAEIHPIFARIVQVEIVVYYLPAAIFGLFYLLARLLDITFRRDTFGTVLGFGIASLGTLIADVLRSEFGTRYELLFQYAPAVAYIIGLVIWLSAFVKAEPEYPVQIEPMPPEQMAEEVGRYITTLKGFFRQTS